MVKGMNIQFVPVKAMLLNYITPTAARRQGNFFDQVAGHEQASSGFTPQYDKKEVELELQEDDEDRTMKRKANCGMEAIELLTMLLATSKQVLGHHHNITKEVSSELLSGSFQSLYSPKCISREE
jgi:hypothetical protein